MNINSNGKLEIDILEIFDGISGDAKVELIERLSCEDAVIKHVIDQVLTGWTENGYSGGTVVNEVESSCELNIARDKIASGASMLARKEYKRLKRVAESKQKSASAAWNEYHKLYNRVNNLSGNY